MTNAESPGILALCLPICPRAVNRYDWYRGGSHAFNFLLHFYRAYMCHLILKNVVLENDYVQNLSLG